jgi:TPR repeat protein
MKSRAAAFIAAFVFCLAALPALADFDAGKKAYDRADWARAIMALRPLAEQGDARALVLMGNMYAQGYGVRRDEAEAYGLYHRAALLGNAEAMVVTGAMLQQGLGTAADVHQAVAWYGRAAEMGHAPGALFYGLYLMRGNNSPDGRHILPDHPAAYKWLRIAEKTAREDKLRDSAAKVADALARTLDNDAREDGDKAAENFKAKMAEELGPAPGTP